MCCLLICRLQPWPRELLLPWTGSPFGFEHLLSSFLAQQTALASSCVFCFALLHAEVRWAHTGPPQPTAPQVEWHYVAHTPIPPHLLGVVEIPSVNRTVGHEAGPGSQVNWHFDQVGNSGDFEVTPETLRAESGACSGEAQASVAPLPEQVRPTSASLPEEAEGALCPCLIGTVPGPGRHSWVCPEEQWPRWVHCPSFSRRSAPFAGSWVLGARLVPLPQPCPLEPFPVPGLGP